jgi:hypothetical protein
MVTHSSTSSPVQCLCMAERSASFSLHTRLETQYPLPAHVMRENGLPGKWLLAYGFARVEMGSRLYRSGGRDGWVNTTIDATTGARPSVPGYNIHLIDQVVSVSLRLANT